MRLFNNVFSHRIIISFAIVWGLLFSSAYGEDAVIKPVLIDKEALSGLGLEPVTRAWASKDRELFAKTVYEGKRFNVVVMAGNTAKTRFENIDYDEFVYVMNGQVTLTEDDGTSQTFKTGDFFMVPKGFSGEWHSQGNRYYQELFVMMKERTGEAVQGNTSPFIIDKTKLSGLEMDRIVWPQNPDREIYRNVLFPGSELEIAVVAGATATTTFTEPMSEEFVYVVNGTATLTPKGGEPQTFYSGDFFVVPEGFIGTWTSRGNHLYRELIALPANR